MSPRLPAGLDRLPSGKVRARYRDRDGKQHSRAFDGVREAQRWRTAQMADVHSGKHVAPNDSTTVLEYARDWVAARLHRETSARVMRAYLLHIESTPLGARPIRLVRTSEIQAFIRDRSEHLAPSTLRNLYITLKAVFLSAVEDRLIPYTPCTSRVVLPRLDRAEVVPLDVEQVRAIAAEVPERYEMAVILQAALGLRISELFGLKVTDIDFFKKTVKVDRQISQDGKRFVPLKTQSSYRVVPLAEDVALLLSAHLAQFPPGPEGTVFTTSHKNPVKPVMYSAKIFKPACVAAGLPDATTHDLRHHFASVLIRMNVPVNVVAKYMGHQTAALVLSTYAHLFPDNDVVTRQALDVAWKSSEQSRMTQER